MNDLHSATPMMPTQEVKPPPRRHLILSSLHVTALQCTSGATEAERPRTAACSWPVGQVLLAFESSTGTCSTPRVTRLLNSQPHWVGGRGNDWRMLLQADYSSAFRLDAVHRGRQVNESVTDDVAASMLGALAGEQRGGVARVDLCRGVVPSSFCCRFFERYGRVNAAQRAQQPHETSVRHAAKNQPKARKIAAHERIVRQSFRIRGHCLGIGRRR
jgi:hypothetical protein